MVGFSFETKLTILPTTSESSSPQSNSLSPSKAPKGVLPTVTVMQSAFPDTGSELEIPEPVSPGIPHIHSRHTHP